jgi:hypothetical protein
MNIRLLSLSKVIKLRCSLFFQEAIPSEAYSFLPLLLLKLKVFLMDIPYFKMNFGKRSGEIFIMNNKMLKMNLN